MKHPPSRPPSDAPVREGTASAPPAADWWVTTSADPNPWWVQAPAPEPPAPCAGPAGPAAPPPLPTTSPPPPDVLAPRPWHLALAAVGTAGLALALAVLFWPSARPGAIEDGAAGELALAASPEDGGRAPEPASRPSTVPELRSTAPEPVAWRPAPADALLRGWARVRPDGLTLPGQAKPGDSDEGVLAGLVRGDEVPEPVAVAPAAPPAAFKRHSRASEEELRRQLEDVPEIGLGPAGQSVLLAYAENVRASGAGAAALTDASPLMRVRSDLKSLPLKQGASCQLSPRSAAYLQLLSRKLRLYLQLVAPTGPDGKRANPQVLFDALRAEKRGRRPEWLRAEAIPTLMQMLMHEDARLRRVLVELLSEVPHSKATVALAQRAVFDLDAEVRQEAVNALKGRKGDEYRPVLLRALRHPWPPAADHAAEALVALGDRASIPHLVALLDQPSPTAPHTLPSKLVTVKEVVRVNHVANCLMCHPPATQGGEPCVGVDPVVNATFVMTQAQAQALQRLLQGSSAGAGGHDYANRATGSASASGGASRGRGGALTTFQMPAMIRGDITFVRQDFSVQLPAPALPPSPPPGIVRPRLVPTGPSRVVPQRFDFVVRTRVLTPREAAPLKSEPVNGTVYPQRESVLFALRELTGEDAGNETSSWRALLPNAPTDVQADALVNEFAKSTALEQGERLARFRHTEGDVNLRALARVQLRATGDWPARARSALVERLALLGPAELRRYLRDETVEVRQAAVLACVRKNACEMVPDLLPLLEGRDREAARLAANGLRTLTGQEHERTSDWLLWWHRSGRSVAGR